ncbi:MAG: hypothetical protein E7057_09690 [Lentisphaerae bacterium]|nr:hypothetical protein [Lentisphaerota bacterium]
MIDAFEKSFAKPLWKKFYWVFSFARKKAWQRKRTVAHASLGVLDRFIFCTAVCGKPGFCKEQAKEHTMYVTARATPARRGIDHNAKQKTLFLKKALQNLSGVTASTTCVRNMLSTYIGNRAKKNKRRSHMFF